MNELTKSTQNRYKPKSRLKFEAHFTQIFVVMKKFMETYVLCRHFLPKRK